MGINGANQAIAHTGARRRVEHGVEVVVAVFDHEHGPAIGYPGVSQHGV